MSEWKNRRNMQRPWNHNIEYHKVIRAALRGAALSDVLDVGCGDGVLARELAATSGAVTAIDVDEASIDRARAAHSRTNVQFILGDFMSYPFDQEAFDAVVSVAALHHMDESDALRRMAVLLRPGGTLAVVGLARSRLPADLPWDVAGTVLTRIRKRRHGGYWETEAPKVWPPPSTYGEVKELAMAALPGVKFRRHAMWRYTLVWKKSPSPQTR